MSTTRRQFVQATVVRGSALGMLPGMLPAMQEPQEKKESQAPVPKLRLGLIGPGGMGTAHLKLLVKRPDVEVAWIAEVDKNRLASATEFVEKAPNGKAPKTTNDLRQVLDDKSIDAVLIATPDHWHTPAALLALDAGKHVYVEKPCSHNIREGRLLVDAVNRTGKVLQVGTQSRSTPTVREAIDRLKSGAIGEILCAKAWNSQRRGSIGKTKPAKPPDTIDFSMWLGPTPETPYRSNMLPGNWRWWKAFGCGDIGNDGVHELDIALWGLGADRQPDRITGAGGKYFFDDDQEFADQMVCTYEWNPTGAAKERKMLVFEQRDWSPYVQEGYENGNAWYGTKGMLILGKGSGWALYGEKNKKIEERSGGIDLSAHHSNFFDAIRQGKAVNAPAIAGHLAASLAHFGNIAVQLGRTLEFDAKTEKFPKDSQADALVRRPYREGHWAVPKGV
jgi:predicted dehydrogenase